jgi:hypothetical protein
LPNRAPVSAMPVCPVGRPSEARLGSPEPKPLSPDAPDPGFSKAGIRVLRFVHFGRDTVATRGGAVVHWVWRDQVIAAGARRTGRIFCGSD